MPPKKTKKSDPYLGPYCSAVGLTKFTLMDLSARQINNGVVLELFRHLRFNRQDTSLINPWLTSLGYGHPLLMENVTALVARRDYLRKVKNTEELRELELLPFNCSDDVVGDDEEPSDPPIASSIVDVAPPVEEPSTSSCVSTKDANLLQHEINKKRKHLHVLEKEVENTKAAVNSIQGHYNPRNVDRRDQRGQQVRIEKRQVSGEKDEVEIEKEQLVAVVASLREEVVSLREKVTSMKLETHRLQKNLHYYKTKQPVTNTPSEKGDGELLNLILENEALQIDLVKQQKNVIVETKKKDGSFTDAVRCCVLELLSLEVSTRMISPTIQCVARTLFDVDVPIKALPTKSTCQKIADEGNFIAKQYIAERLKACSSFGIHKDGTSRKKKKILDTAICLDSGESFSLGFSVVASETGQAIADDSISKLKEVNSDDGSLKSAVEKLSYTMSDRAANEKASNRIFSTWRSKLLSDNSSDTTSSSSTPSTLHHFFCLAHVLFGFHSESVKALKSVQTKLRDGGKMGRALDAGFKCYVPD